MESNKRKELREHYREVFDTLSEDLGKDEAERFLNQYIDNIIHINKDPNAINLSFPNCRIEYDLERIEKILEDVGIPFGYHDRSLEIQNSFKDVVFTYVWLAMPDSLFEEIYNDVEGNLKWDTIKTIIKILLNKIKGKFVKSGNRLSVQEDPLKLSIKTTTMEFELDGIPEERFDSILDLIPDLLSNNFSSTKPRYRYDHESDDWQRIN